mgnify:FL=1
MTQQSPDIERLGALYEEATDQIQKDYFNFLRFKSISSEVEYKSEVLDCAKWLKNYLEEAQFKVEFWEGNGHPVVFGENLDAGPDKPTILF